MKQNNCTSSPALDVHDRWAKKCMKKYGFYTHFVFDKDFENSPSGVNLHTHGITESCSHPDFQITIPLDPEIANGIFHNLFNRVKGGDVFAAGDIVNDILGNDLKISFIDANECGRHVLRVILPDPAGNIKKSKMRRKWREAQF
jgi:hypothetical protein